MKRTLRRGDVSARMIAKTARETSGFMASLEAHATFIEKANEYVNDGLRGIDYSRVNRGGAEGSPTELAAMSELAGMVDQTSVVMHEFCAVLERQGRDARRLEELRQKLVVIWTKEAREAAEFVARQSHGPAGAGDCKVCGRLVSGSRIDRLREGRCGACARYHQRNPGKERPKHLWGGDSLDDQCQAILTRGGVDYRCALLHGHEEECQFPTEEVA